LLYTCRSSASDIGFGLYVGLDLAGWNSIYYFVLLDLESTGFLHVMVYFAATAGLIMQINCSTSLLIDYTGIGG
jgi:hypothetical protein